MNSSNHPSAYGYQPQRPGQLPYQPRPQVQENTLKSGDLQVERKSYRFSLKENDRGRLLRITEEAGGRFNSIIIPATGLAEFKLLLDEMIRASEEMPEKGKQEPQ